MANTIMTAKNTFAEGLIMDFAPDNTQATCMTSALNATLLTFNGNEMSLQNDMGNGRVETAYLPEGYIPVGTCEFGDIIYIVSYNPITDQSLIGCFPSPERNISSEEIYYSGGSGFQSLSNSEFLELEGGTPNGTLKNLSVLKVLIDSKKLNPGDKYIIYSDNNGISNNADCLSDLAGNMKHGDDPKNVKLHIVSIDDSGKITYLDSTTKWYDVDSRNKYYIDSQASVNVNGNMVPDIDSYRTMLLSGWSIFSSKVSGKLAILAELETIKTFSCAYKLSSASISTRGNIKEKTYTITIVPEWETDGRDPSYIMLTKAGFNNTRIEKDGELTKEITLNPNEVYYSILDTSATSAADKKYIITTLSATTIKGGPSMGEVASNEILLGNVTIPYQQNIGTAEKEEWVNIKSPSFVYSMEITPAMNFGRLDHLAVTIEIDFNKVGTGEVELTDWRYHNSGNTSILLYGLGIYPEPNLEVSSVTIDFLDNIGLVGRYELTGKKAYSGTRIEYFGLNGEAYNSRFTRTDADGNVIKHPGTLIEGDIYDPNYDYAKDDNYCVHTDGKTYTNDARTLYSGYLYLATIKINYTSGKPKTIYRWFWTNSMFNEYFYLESDFKDLNFELVLDGEALFESVPTNFLWKQKEINNLGEPFETGENWKTFSANAQYIGRDGDNNINMYINAGLLNNYDCFNLNQEDLDKIKLDIWLADTKINYSIPDLQYEFSDKETAVTYTLFLSLPPIENKDATTPLTELYKYLDKTELINTGPSTTILDGFNIFFFGVTPIPDTIGDNDDINAYKLEKTLADCYYMSKEKNAKIPLSMLSVLFNKSYVQDVYSTYVNVPVYTPIINSKEDLTSLGIAHLLITGTDSKKLVKLAFSTGMVINLHKNTFYGIDLNYNTSNMYFESAMDDDDKHKFDCERMVNVGTDTDFTDKIWGNVSSRMGLFFPVYLGGYKSTGRFNAINGSIGSSESTEDWQIKRASFSSVPKDAKSSILSEDPFDINSSGTISETKTGTNTTSFLGMKFQNGMTLFNNAFMDTSSGSNFLQKDCTGGLYDNFAYLLYLILSNTYHRDKRILDKEINMKNYVRNANYSVELTKNIIIKLYEGSMHDILVHNIKFSEIIKGYDKNLYQEDFNFAGSKNITLKLLSCAKNNELKISVNNKPMSFLDTEISAYIMRNGVLTPCNNLADSFYMYLEGKLYLYANRLVTFSHDDVITNLRYVFDSKDINGLYGARRKTSTVFTDHDLAYNTYLKQIEKYWLHKGTYHYPAHSRDEALYLRDKYVTDMITSLLESDHGYTKNLILDDMRTEFWWNLLFDIYESGGNYAFVVLINAIKETSYKTGSNTMENEYKIDTYLNLGLFKYENGLVLNPAGSFNTFGIRDDITNSDIKSAYGGFMRNVVIDLNYQVVRK